MPGRLTRPYLTCQTGTTPPTCPFTLIQWSSYFSWREKLIRPVVFTFTFQVCCFISQKQRRCYVCSHCAASMCLRSRKVVNLCSGLFPVYCPHFRVGLSYFPLIYIVSMCSTQRILLWWHVCFKQWQPSVFGLHWIYELSVTCRCNMFVVRNLQFFHSITTQPNTQ